MNCEQQLTPDSFPEEIAERAWDNVGLLLGNIETAKSSDKAPVVLVTNDLTYAVAQEAVEKGASVIVSYRECSIRHIVLCSSSLQILC